MNSHTYTTFYSIEDDELVIEFTAYAGCRGARDKYGVPLEPDDPPELEIISVKKSNGDEFEPDEELNKKLEAKCWEHLADLESEPDHEPNYDERNYL